MTPYFSEQFDGVKYNHFHEWEEDNDELFQIIPLAPTHDPTVTPLPPPSTRASKFRNVIKLVTGKKLAKKAGDKSEETQSDWSSNKHATLPRMNREERDARIRYLRDEVFGLGRFYQEPDPTKLYESEDPSPFVPSRTKTVRWKSDPTGSRNVGNMEFNVDQESHDVEADENDIAISNNTMPRENNPYWEEEFELPEPDLIYNLNSPSQHEPQAECIAIDLSDIFLSEFGDEPLRPTSPLDLKKNATDTDTNSITDYFPDNSILRCTCGDPSCNASCVHVLTVKGIQANLGQEIADLIVTEMILRLGPPLPLPPRDVDESQTEVLAVRKTAVVQMYAKWAATFTFQKLVVAIKLSLDHFKPSHRGIVNFEFQDYGVFRNIDMKTKYLVIRKMRVVFDEHVRVLQNKCPKDATFRQKIIGAPFWAEGQEYIFTPAGNYSGVLLNYKIKRGGVGTGQKTTGATKREPL